MKKNISKIVSFFLGKSYVSTYRSSTEISWKTGWHSSDVVSEYLNGKGREYFCAWMIGVGKKDNSGYFIYTIEWWPKKIY